MSELELVDSGLRENNSKAKIVIVTEYKNDMLQLLSSAGISFLRKSFSRESLFKMIES